MCSGDTLRYVLALLGTIPFRPVPAGAQTAPALPQGTVDTTRPAIAGNTYLAALVSCRFKGLLALRIEARP